MPASARKKKIETRSTWREVGRSEHRVQYSEVNGVVHETRYLRCSPVLRRERTSHGRSVPCFFFCDTSTTEIYTLSLHDALPISGRLRDALPRHERNACTPPASVSGAAGRRSEEHTSELQSRVDLVCRILLEKKKKRVKREFDIKKKKEKDKRK